MATARLVDLYRRMMALGASSEMVEIMLEAWEAGGSRVEEKSNPVDTEAVPVEPTAHEKRKEWDRARKAKKRLAAQVGGNETNQVENPVETPSPSPSPLVPPLSPAPLSPPIIPPTTPSSRRGTRLPVDFIPDVSCETLARELGFTNGDWTTCLAEFRDYWAGVSGSKGVKVDWQATLRNSIRRFERKKPNGKPYQSARQSHAESAKAAIAAQRAVIIGEGEDADFGESQGSGPVIEGEFGPSE